MNNTCFCLITNVITLSLLERINKINNEIKDADFWIIYDSVIVLPPYIMEKHINVFFVNKDEIIKNNLIDKDADYRKNLDKILLYFYINNNLYDYYYFMENDVAYFGNYNNFILNYINDDCDVLIQNDANYFDGKKTDNNFYELFDNKFGLDKHSIEIPFPNCIQEMYINEDNANIYPYKRIYQIFRFSNRFMKTYTDLVQNKQIGGHFEWAYTSTILKYNFKFNYMKEKMYLFFNEQKDLNRIIYNENLNNCFVHHKKNL